MRTLAIETSCDDTAVAIVEQNEANGSVSVRANFLSSQVALHAAWGGVVPNLAAREHSRNLQPLIEAAFAETKLAPQDIDLISVTAGPGLVPALVIGVQTAKTLAYRWRKPLLGIHHIEGHIYANFIRNDQFPSINFQKNHNNQAPISKKSDGLSFPLLALVVSGGHTQLVLMRDHFDYEILGETQDDAVGEAFDKVAKMVGLPYPGGPVVARCASNFQASISNFQKNSKSNLTPNPARNGERSDSGRPLLIQGEGAIPFNITLPRPMIHSGDFKFSFSGIKTAVLYTIQRQTPEIVASQEFINAICYEFQNAAVEVLVSKTKQALEKYNSKTVVIAGGVSANTHLREQLASMIARDFPDTAFRMPEFTYSLDNAAMIGAAALLRWQHLSKSDRAAARETWRTLEPNANLKLHPLSSRSR
jgi:N6-L-threonylcarbamoyladenine synthase